MNVIIERQSPDWDSPHCDADTAATLLANSLYGPSVEGLKYAAYTRELHALWESCFSTSLAFCRNFLKELAHENWRQVKNCQAIFSESQHPVVSKTIFGRSGWILFTDDDDWFSPEIFARIEDIISQNPSNCVLWNRVRFDGHMTITPITPTAEFPLYAYTNNYAVRADTFSAGIEVASVMQHGFANGMIEDKQWHVLFAPSAVLSVTNKSPCSWNYLDQAKKSDDPQRKLVQLVEQYAWPSVKLDGELRWAESHVRTTQQFFQDLLRAHIRT